MTTSLLDVKQLVAELDFDLNVGDALARRALLQAARELAAETPIPIEISVPLQDGVALYDYSDQIPEGFTVECVDCVTYCGRCIEHIKKCDPCPHGYESCSMDLTQIQIHPTPRVTNTDETLDLRLHLKPKFDSPNIPEYFCKFADVLTDLARSRLAEMPSQPWTNVGYANEMRQRAESCMVSNTVRQSRNGSGSQRCTSGHPVL